MAKNLGLLENGSGKIGNVVLQRNNVQRVRKRQIKNPRTTAQQVSRMIAATATRTYSVLKSIVDHSFQGVEYGGKSMNYFLSNAMRDLRNRAAYVTWAGGEETPFTFGFIPKNQNGCVPGEFLVSKGTLVNIGGVNTKETTSGGETVKSFVFKFKDQAVDKLPTPAQLISLGVQAGDQITFMCVDCSNVADGLQTPILRVSRIVLTSDFDSEAGWDTSYVDQEKTTPSIYSAIETTPNADLSTFVFGANVNIETGYGCIILSRRGSLQWERSTEHLRLAGDDSLAKVGPYWYNAALITWLMAAESVGDSPYYLNEGD